MEPSLNGISPQEIKSAGGYQEGGEVRETLLSKLSGGKYQTSQDLPSIREQAIPALEFMTGAEHVPEGERASLLDLALAVPIAGKLGKIGRGAKKLSGKAMRAPARRGAGAVQGLKKKLIKEIDESGLPDAYGEPMSYFKDMHTDDLAGILKDYYGKELYQANRGLHSALKKGGYQEGGQVPSGNWGPKGAYNEALEQSRKEDMSPKELQAMAMLDSLRQFGGERLESLPSDSYGGKEVSKNAMTIIPYLKSFGRMRTPLQEQERFMFQRYGLNPDALPPQLQGLRGLALRQRMGNEGI